MAEHVQNPIAKKQAITSINSNKLLIKYPPIILNYLIYGNAH